MNEELIAKLASQNLRRLEPILRVSKSVSVLLTILDQKGIVTQEEFWKMFEGVTGSLDQAMENQSRDSVRQYLEENPNEAKAIELLEQLGAFLA